MSEQSGVETVRVKLPTAFDPTKHLVAVEKKIIETHGDGFQIVSIDDAKGGDKFAVAERRDGVTQVFSSTSKKKVVKLAKTVKSASDGDRQAAILQENNPGYYLTKFEPFLSRAEMTKLTIDEVRCREAIALVIGCKPWDVSVASRLDGGYEVGLPASKYQPRHNEKIEEVATEVVGEDGWYVKINARKLTASLIPSKPPTFPSAIGTPMKRLGRGNRDFTPFGMKLPSPGQEVGEEIGIDWTAQAFAMLAGMPGSGKTVTLNALIADAKSNGAELVIVDDQAKAVDFMWCRDLVRPGGWGCDSVAAAVATLSLVYEEGKRRAEILAEGGYVNWTEMPKGKQFTPIFIVVDEVSALLVTDKIPSGVPKDHPDVVELIQMNFLKFKLQALIGKIIAEQRFVGMRMVISTQVTNNTTGVPPSLKAKIGHKILQGVNPSKNARVQAFSDEAAVPYVPANVRNGGSVARGVGVADLEGDAPVVYKSYFATTGDYRDRLISLGARPIRNFAPTPAQIAKYAPDLNEEFDDGGFDSGLDGGGWGEQDGRDKPEPKLRGAAAAAHALKVEAAAAR